MILYLHNRNPYFKGKRSEGIIYYFEIVVSDSTIIYGHNNAALIFVPLSKITSHFCRIKEDSFKFGTDEKFWTHKIFGCENSN